MVRQVDEDAVAAARAMRGYEKRRERIALEEKQGTINILDAASSELTGLGLKAKVLSEDEVELTWSTDDEDAEIIANAQKIAKKKRSNLYNEDGVAYARCSA